MLLLLAFGSRKTPPGTVGLADGDADSNKIGSTTGRLPMGVGSGFEEAELLREPMKASAGKGVTVLRMVVVLGREVLRVTYSVIVAGGAFCSSGVTVTVTVTKP